MIHCYKEDTLPQVFQPEKNRRESKDILFLSYIQPRHLHTLSSATSPGANPFRKRRVRYAMELDYRNRLRQEAVLEVLQANNRKRNGKLRKKPQDDNVVQIEPLIKPGESFDTEKIV